MPRGVHSAAVVVDHALPHTSIRQRLPRPSADLRGVAERELQVDGLERGQVVDAQGVVAQVVVLPHQVVVLHLFWRFSWRGVVSHWRVRVSHTAAACVVSVYHTYTNTHT